MIDRTEKPKIPSKFAKRDTNNLPVILYETMSWLPTQTGNLLFEGLNGFNRQRKTAKNLVDSRKN